MSLAYIRKTYAVPAKRGGRVLYKGGDVYEAGTILGAMGGHLLIRLDSRKHSAPFHPTWEIDYLPPEPASDQAGVSIPRQAGFRPKP